MAELADALDLGSSGVTLAGSTPVTRTIEIKSRTLSDSVINKVHNIWYYGLFSLLKGGIKIYENDHKKIDFPRKY